MVPNELKSGYALVTRGGDRRWSGVQSGDFNLRASGSYVKESGPFFVLEYCVGILSWDTPKTGCLIFQP